MTKMPFKTAHSGAPLPLAAHWQAVMAVVFAAGGVWCGCDRQGVEIRVGEGREEVLGILRAAYSSATLTPTLGGPNKTGEYREFFLLTVGADAPGQLDRWHLLAAFSPEGKVSDLARIRQVPRAGLVEELWLVPAEEARGHKVVRWLEPGQKYPPEGLPELPGSDGYSLALPAPGGASAGVSLHYSSQSFPGGRHSSLHRRFLWARDPGERITRMFFLDLGAKAADIARETVTLIDK